MFYENRFCNVQVTVLQNRLALQKYKIIAEWEKEMRSIFR